MSNSYKSSKLVLDTLSPEEVEEKTISFTDNFVFHSCCTDSSNEMTDTGMASVDSVLEDDDSNSSGLKKEPRLAYYKTSLLIKQAQFGCKALVY